MLRSLRRMSVIVLAFVITLFLSGFTPTSAQPQAGSLTLDPGEVKLTIQDCNSSPDGFTAKRVNTSSNAITGLQVKGSGEIKGWLKFYDAAQTVEANKSNQQTIVIKVPCGQSAKTYSGSVTYTGKTRKGSTTTTVTATMKVSVTVPVRPNMKLVVRVNGGSNSATVTVGKQFTLDAEITNTGNTPLSPFADLTLPQSWNKDKYSNNCGSTLAVNKTCKVTWKITAQVSGTEILKVTAGACAVPSTGSCPSREGQALIKAKSK